MSRATQIIDGFTQGREFAYPRSAEEILALAYDELVQKMHKLERENERLRAERQTTIEARALDLTRNYRAELLPHPIDPAVWAVKLQPILYEFRGDASHPSKWHPSLKQHIVHQAGDTFAALIMKAFEQAGKA